MTYKPTREFNGVVGEKSKDTMGPETLSRDLDEINIMFDPDATHTDSSQGGISKENLNFSLEDDGSVSGTSMAEQIGSKEITELKDPDNQTLQALTIWKQIKAIVLLHMGHITNFLNPHEVTKQQVGLGSVDNTSDSAKPVSISQQAALNGKVNKTGDESIAGIKTFSSPPIIPAPTADTQAATKKYVDDVDLARKEYVDGKDVLAVHLAGNEIISGVKTFSASPGVPAPTANTHASTKKYVDDVASLKANSSDVYSKTNLQTTGQALVHWGNLTNVPNMADASWKTAVPNKAALPLTGNSVNDQRVVLDDGDAKQAMYVCIATSGTVDQQWDKIGDVDWTNDHSNLVGLYNDDHAQYHNDTRGDARYYTKSQEDLTHNSFITKTNGEVTSDFDFNSYQALNFVAQKSATEPDPAEAKFWYDTVNKRLKVYKGELAGWTDISSRGAVIRELEFTATEGQTVFDTSSIGAYTVGDNSMAVHKKNIAGRYEKLDRGDYTETDDHTVTLIYPAMEDDEYLLRWFEATADLINLTVLKDGTLQVNLNADMLDGKHESEFAKYKSGLGTFTAGGTTCTVTDVFITANTLVIVSPTAAKSGIWSVVAANGSFTITSDTTETNDVTFDWGCTK